MHEVSTSLKIDPLYSLLTNKVGVRTAAYYPCSGCRFSPIISRPCNYTNIKYTTTTNVTY